VAGVVRGVHEGLPRPPVLPEGPDDLPALLAGADSAFREEERRARPLEPGERLDPNRASEVELDRLPGVGPSTAEAIVAGREASGGYRRPDDLLEVRGIGPATLAKIRDHLELDGAVAAAASAPGPSRARERPAMGPGDGARVGRSSAASLDLNRADGPALERLPGVGPALAERILALRRSKGRFRSVDELLEVRGIGPATLERIRNRVRVGG
jgi:competence protein ComEA